MIIHAKPFQMEWSGDGEVCWPGTLSPKPKEKEKEKEEEKKEFIEEEEFKV